MAEFDMQAEAAFWEARGQGDAFRAAVGAAAPPASPPPPAPAPGSPGGAPPPPAADPQRPGITASVASAYRAAIADGHMTEVQARASLDSYDKASVDAALQGVAVEPNEDIRELDRAGFRGAKPEEISISYDRDSLAHLDPLQFQKFDRELKLALSEMEIPVGAAGNIGKMIADIAARYQAMQPAERQAWEAKQAADMVNVFGAARAKEMHAAAATAFAKIANLDLAQNIVQSGALGDAQLVVALAQTTSVSAMREAVRGGASITSIVNQPQGA